MAKLTATDVRLMLSEMDRAELYLQSIVKVFPFACDLVHVIRTSNQTVRETLLHAAIADVEVETIESEERRAA